MCGLIGTTELGAKNFSRALGLLEHRGPDGGGLLVGEDIQLGHRRLSIIDLTQDAAQPMSDSDGSVTITFNGEIYNYESLRKELSGKGVVFRTKSDTEVILEGYRHEGTKFFKKLRGMWAFAIYDKKTGIVVLSRDAFGIKPIYYTEQNGHLYFASEIKALKEFNIKLELNTEGYRAFFSLGYFISPDTCFKGIFSLAPNTTLIYNIKSKKIEFNKIDEFVVKESILNDEGEILSDLDVILTKSVEAHYVADVPVGILFSGGTDSSLIAALSRKLGMNPTAYHLDIEGSIDTEYAHSIAYKLGLDLEVMEMRGIDLVAQYEKVWDLLDTPFADISIIPTSLIFEKIGKKAKVILGGEGGDEWFGGYTRHKSLEAFRVFRERNLLLSLLNSLESNSSLGLTHYNPILHKIRNQLVQLQRDVIGAYLARVSTIDYPLNRDYLRKKLFTLYRSKQNELQVASLFYDRHIYLSNDLLIKTDVASMASSIEARVPFVDVEVYKYLLTHIPGQLCTSSNGEQKYLLKKVLERYLPRELVYRKKSGFGFSFKKYHIPHFHEDVHDAFRFHRNEADTFGLTDIYHLLQDQYVDVIIDKYPRFAFALVSNWKLCQRH